MIVKDEAKVIEKCLSSVKPLIDYWAIVDTGSSDNTKQLIDKMIAGIPGEFHERPWVNFAHNRNEALEFTKNKGDYVLFIDAVAIPSMTVWILSPRPDLHFRDNSQRNPVAFRREHRRPSDHSQYRRW
jgi:glycosyltransferase involved in cell wall biosynthesis